MPRHRGVVWTLLCSLQTVLTSFNCFSQVDESKWSLVVGHNVSTASISVFVSGAGPNVVTCLNGQQNQTYRVSLSGDPESQRFIHPWLHSWEGGAEDLVGGSPMFPYLIYGGRYRLEFSTCRSSACDNSVYSDYINIQSEVKPWCEPDTWEGNSTNQIISDPSVSGTTGLFKFTFDSCSEVQHYDSANITLYESSTKEECGSNPLLYQTLKVESSGTGSAEISYRSPDVQGDHYYCVSVTLSHISCHLSSVEAPSSCSLRSEPVWIPSVPLIALIFPFCSSHLGCAWLYITILGSVFLLVSLVLAVLCVRCCDRRTKYKQNITDEVDFSGEVINLTTTSLPDRRTWSEIHADWEDREDRPRGKILLLYSPDTKLFKELQEALKSFLDLACHCDIYDLFDDALFDTIAMDPAGWLQEFVNDREVKIILISSIGAYRRQMALQGQMPLNLPENSLLDGLFTSGLRFVSTHPGLLSSGRVATARYEMLHLTEEGHSFLPPVGGNREFLIPTQLHELFCWVHHLQPLELMGKPWVNYHLELQLLQDALKLVRRDRTLVGNCSGMGNGLTII